MPTIDITTFQSLNMAMAAGMSVFAALFIIAKWLFVRPALENRLEALRFYSSIVDPLSLKANLYSQFLRHKKRSNSKKGSLKKRILDYLLKNFFLDGANMKVVFEQAGWVSRETQFFFFASKLFFVFSGFAVGYLVILGRPSFTALAFPVKWLVLILASLVGWLAPDFYLKGTIRNRVTLIEKQFPDALDLIIICLQGGLGLNRAIDRVAKEIGLFGKEIAHELGVTNVEMEVMLDRRQALQNLHARVPSPMIRTFTTTVLQSLQQGTPTLQALDVLSREIRDTRMQKAEAKAARLPSLMVIPLVLFVMPNLFILLLGPAIVKLLNLS